MQNHDDDLAVTLKDLHVDETLVDPPVAGIDPLEGTVFSPEEVADVSRHVFEPAATPLEKALTVLAQAFLEDDGPASYRHSWVANMAMCFFDEMRHLVDDRVEKYGDIHIYQHEIRDVANASAERFISLLLKNIETPMHKVVEERLVEFLNRRVNELLAEKDGFERDVEMLCRRIEGHCEREKELLDERDATKKELFEVGIQMKNAAAHARHLVDAIDFFAEDLKSNTPYAAVDKFLKIARSYSGNTETEK